MPLPPGGVGAGTKEDREEWQQRATKFDVMVQEVVALFEKLCSCQNRELVYDLYSYLWDICTVLLTLNGFVHWLARGCCTPKLQSYVVGQQTWFSGKNFTIKYGFALYVIIIILVSYENVKKCVLGGCTITSSKTKINVV